MRITRSFRTAGRISIDALACPGKVTVVDFSSDYCAPCVELAMFLIQTSKSYPERYAIRRVNINRPGFNGIDYQSPVSKQYNIKDLPLIVVYDNKVKVAEGTAGPPVAHRRYQEDGSQGGVLGAAIGGRHGKIRPRPTTRCTASRWSAC